MIRVGKKTKNTSDIIIPDTAKEKPQEGKIISTGTGNVEDDGKRIPMEVKAGDRVLFSKYGGTEIKIDGVEHIPSPIPSRTFWLPAFSTPLRWCALPCKTRHLFQD